MWCAARRLAIRDASPLCTAHLQGKVMDALDLLRSLAQNPRTPNRAERDALRALFAKRRDDHVASLAAQTGEPLVAQALLDGVGADWAKLTPIERLVFVQSEDNKVEAAIDRHLGGSAASSMCRALARAGVAWTHDGIEAMLDSDDEQDVAAAAMVLASYEPEGLYGWCDEAAEQGDAGALVALRAALLATEVTGAYPVLEAIRDDLSGQKGADAESVLIRLDALLALVDPKRWGRGVLGESYTFDWVETPALVADVLQLHGETSWLETLAWLELGESVEGRIFASNIAACAALAHVEITQEAQADALAALLEVTRTGDEAWAPRAAGLDCQLALTLGDEDTSPLLVEAIVHERLLYGGFAAPGIVGLPLSASDEEGLDTEAAEQLLRDVSGLDELLPAGLVAAVRTLSDLKRWRELAPELVSFILDDEELMEGLCGHPLTAVRTAANIVVHGLSEARLRELATQDGPVALWAISQLAESAADPSATLGALWAVVPVERVPYVRMWME
jgi:hypothetical protein